MEGIGKETRFVRGPFWRFFGLLMAAELTTITLTLLLLGGATRLWLREQARGLADKLPQMVAQLDVAEIERIRWNDTPAMNPAYKSVVARLNALTRSYLPASGHRLSIVIVDGNDEAKIASPEDQDDQQSIVGWFPAEPYALEAMQNKVSYSPYPYTMPGGVENITAYAPITDANGEVKFLLTVDRDTSSLAENLRMVRYSFLLAVFPATLVSVALAAFLSSRFVDVLDFLRMIHEITPRRRLSPTLSLPRLVPEDDSAPSESDGDAPVSPSAASSSLVEDAIMRHTPPDLREPVPSALDEDPVDPRWASLTDRERETATLSYLKYKEIAERMGISVEGVKKHSQNARAKLGVRDRVEMALYAVRMGALGDALPSSDGAHADESP